MNKTDLEERLVNFSVLIIEIVNELPNSKAGNHLGGQIIRSGTALALNYGKHKVGNQEKILFIN